MVELLGPMLLLVCSGWRANKRCFRDTRSTTSITISRQSHQARCCQAIEASWQGSMKKSPCSNTQKNTTALVRATVLAAVWSTGGCSGQGVGKTRSYSEIPSLAPIASRNQRRFQRTRFRVVSGIIQSYGKIDGHKRFDMSEEADISKQIG